MTEEEKDLLIERYLTHELSEEEIAYVESLRKNDEDFNRNLKAQKIIRDTLKYAQVKANLNRIIDEYSLKESDNAEKGKFIKPWMAVAASIVLLVGFMGYAFHKAGYISFDNLWNKEKPVKLEKQDEIFPKDSIIQKDEENIQPSDTLVKKNEKPINNARGIKFEGIEQSIFIKTKEFTTISTGSGIMLSFPANTLTNTVNPKLDSVEITYREIIKAQDVTIDNSKNKVIKIFKLSYANEDWKLNMSLPISFSLETEGNKHQVYYGGNNKDLNDWKIISNFDTEFIKTPTKIMADYQAYLESIKLIDSISNHFDLVGEYYISKADKNLKLNSDFVLGRYGFIQQYQDDKALSYKVNLAIKSWETYNAQHNINVNKDSSYKVSNQNYINRPGWYAVVKRE